jgi:hypothetical protein
MSKCIFTENNNQCKLIKKENYGMYCYKHRRYHLVDDNNIIKSRFTNMEKDYLKKDLINYCKKNKIIISDNLKKKDIFHKVKVNISNDTLYDNKKIIYLQKLIKEFNKKNRKKCNNNEDFNTFENIIDIESKYYFAYNDNRNIKWGFDIRSLKKLLDLGLNNPYTMEEFTEDTINNINKRITDLKNNNNYCNFDDLILKDKKSEIKQKCVDLFSLIDQCGHSCNIEWFLSLNIRRLKELYKQLEDIWNYRCQLSEEVKRRICPPDANIFKTPITEVMNYQNKEDLQELILHDVLKFKNGSDSDQKLGIIYFLLGLSYVSNDCYNIHNEWIGFILQ